MAAYPCTDDPGDIIEFIVKARDNAGKFDKFINGTDLEEVPLGTGLPTPTLRNVVHLVKSAAATLDGSDVSGKFSDAGNGGTVLRMLSERFAEWINVRDFGAIGDGETDDADAIQAALDYANEDGDNRPVVAFGTFLITKPLVVGRDGTAAYRQAKQEQHFIFEKIIVDADHWQGSAGAPAITLRGWRPIMEGPSRLLCNKACAGIKIDTYGATVYKPAVSDFAVGTYGLTWESGGNCIFNPIIRHDRATEASILADLKDTTLTDVQRQNRITPGILLRKIDSDHVGGDSKVFGGVVGNCTPGIQLKDGAAFNFFHGIHVYCGSSEHPVVDPVLVRNESASPNYLFNTYFDSGHVDFYDPNLVIMGGHFLDNSGISTLNGRYFRYFCSESSGNFSKVNVFNVKNADAGFYNGSKTIPNTYDYSAINAIEPDSGREIRCERQTLRILPNGYNASFDIAYKPVGTLSRSYFVGSGSGVEIEYLDNAVRIHDGNTNSPGARIYLGGGSSGIGENPDGGGQTFVYANGVAHLQLAGASSQSGYVRPEITDNDTLGSANHIWKEIFCGSDTINTSDERLKQQLAAVPDAVFRAWGKVGFVQYKWNKAVESKGEAARIHVGLIAQKIVEAFEEEGLDAARYGLLCYDEWPAETHSVTVVDKEAVVDEEDRTVEPEVSHVETVVEPAGSRYSLRYAECLCMEAAYQRWLGEKRDARIAELEARLNDFSGNESAPSGASLDNI